jgi:hypothetical protein
MLANVFQQANHPMALEAVIVHTIEEAFQIVDRLQGGDEDYHNADDGDELDEVLEGQQQVVGETLPEDGVQQHAFDPVVLEMEPLYTSAKCTKLAATIIFMSLCTVHGVNNKFAFLDFICYLNPIV